MKEYFFIGTCIRKKIKNWILNPPVGRASWASRPLVSEKTAGPHQAWARLVFKKIHTVPVKSNLRIHA